ncbi:dentin sialophosphoprotein [Linepithema humile]|uniref:dentin sialophosphoprotein n=1 Tax=Linepithema humile TaxID=83485 RepID=UPI00351F5780
MCYVNANYEYERMKALSYLTDISQSPSNNQYNIYEGASSEIAPYYYDSYEPNKDRDLSRDHFGSLFKRSPIDSIKKESIEKKNLKKVMPFYAFPNKDLIKRKELLADSTETAHCQEIKIKSFGKDSGLRKGVTTCYKCKDPITRSTYERCLYKSHPEERASASTKVERFLSVPTSFRYRRSNLEKGKIDYEKLKRDPYRFTDKYFTDATYDAPVAHESKGEKCDKIIKNSMVCMVCQNAKTNSKYEQCSYVKQPREEAYSYDKSDSYRNKPEQQRNDSVEYPESTSYSEPSDFAASNRQKKDRNSTATEESPRYYYSEDYPERTSTANERDEVQDAPSQADCKQIKKDSKICTVCKDSKNGGTYEKCTYNYQPSDKLYKYSRSKSFGFPDKPSHSTRDSNQKTQTSEESKDSDHPQSSDSTDDYLGRIKSSTYPRRSDRVSAETQVASDPESASRDLSDYSSDYFKGLSDYQLPTNKDDEPKYYGDQAVPSSKSVSEHQSENINEEHCKKVQKDSMTCTICKDPKTGNDFEQCSYSYHPSDKLFSYSKSSSFGNPQKNDKSQQVPQESEQSSESLETATSSYDEYTPGQIYEASTADETKSEDDVEGKKAVDTGYLDTVKKKAQIEEFMQNFQKQDRSKCKKIMRDKMTCYQCIDEDGFQKEECVFITGREPGDKDQLAFREVKEFQVDPTAHTSQIVSNSKTVDSAVEPSASASGNSYVRLEKPDNDYPDEKPNVTEETKETEPYDYTSETRSKYDKVLGLTLPAYMFTISEHEAAFDEVVASSHDQR